MALRADRARRVGSLLAGIALLAAGCSGSDATSEGSDAARATTTTRAGSGTTTTTQVAEEFGDGDFYVVPDPLPAGPHGTLIRYQALDEASLPEGASAYRIMYLSESMQGDPIAVTGTALVPDTPAPDGGRPVLTIAHGTTGIADECAPSKAPGSELLLMRPAIDQGWLVAYTDYEGLGTPGRHPYLVGESEGRGVLDAVVAAGSLPKADIGSRVAIAGYSQGGHGALWANEIAAEWAPGLEVVGTFAGAPATEMGVILAAAPRLPIAGFAYMIVAGFGAAYPEADPSTFLTEAGVDKLDLVDSGCGRDVISAFAGTSSADLIRPDGPGNDPWPRLADENNPGSVKTADPVLIIHSDGDDVVPVALSGMLLDRMCKSDQVVERRVVVDGGGHGAAAPAAYADALDWLGDRFAGTGTPVDTCRVKPG